MLIALTGATRRSLRALAPLGAVIALSLMSAVPADSVHARGSRSSGRTPDLSIQATPTSVPYGGTTTISWSAQRAATCQASGDWAGTRSSSGSEGVSELRSNATFTLTCWSSNNASSTKTVNVAVESAPAQQSSGQTATPAPSVTLSAAPTSVVSGNGSTLNWSSANAKGCTASGGWSGARAISGSESTGALTSGKTYRLDCVGDGGTATQSTTVTVTQASAGASSGLDFQGSDATSGTVRFQFDNPPTMYPATYIWRVKPRQQSGYYTTFFWGNNGSFLWNQGSPGSYYGAHPYPAVPPNGSTHKWEIAVGGGDVVSGEDVVYDVWYTQALRVWSDSSGKHHEFYWNLPDTTKVVRATEPTSYGEMAPPSPALTFGDAPWNPSNEILNGVLRGIQIYTESLSVSDIAAEINAPLSTSAGQSSVWYLNLNPTPGDISDKSGKGNHPTWVGAERPNQWNAQ